MTPSRRRTIFEFQITVCKKLCLTDVSHNHGNQWTLMFYTIVCVVVAFKN